MEDGQNKPASEAAPEKPPKIKANDNPWYLLATLYGEPADELDDHRRGELQARNRIVWNRYYSANLDDEPRVRLIHEKRHPAEELTPFSEEEARQIAIDFAARSIGADAELPLPDASEQIDFKRVEFGRDADFSGYLFAWSASARQIGYPLCSGAVFRGSTFYGQAIFTGATFYGGADFGGATFRVRAGFVASAMLFGITEFKRATFSGLADFRSAIFQGATDFQDATFHQGATFNSVTFIGGSIFIRARFCSVVDFDNATFSDGVHHFDEAIFSALTDFRCRAIVGPITFVGATFQDHARFPDTTFSNQVSFEKATFCDLANFIGAIFLRRADFANAKFKAEASFERATFRTEPPRFFGTELHEGMVWPDYESWPVPEVRDGAKKFVRAYERLKFEMDRLKKHEDELNFFALELRSRRVLLGPWKGWPISVYGAVADYGCSYWRPLGWLCGVVLVGGIVLLAYFDLWVKLPLDTSIGQSFGLSLANTLNVFGFRKEFFDATSLTNLPAWIKVLSGAQTILGVAGLFLFGLGIRNRFRMK